jgi:hypothetical protein
LRLTKLPTHLRNIERLSAALNQARVNLIFF